MIKIFSEKWSDNYEGGKTNKTIEILENKANAFLISKTPVSAHITFQSSIAYLTVTYK